MVCLTFSSKLRHATGNSEIKISTLMSQTELPYKIEAMWDIT
jgi:hypothetical protein